MKITGKCKEDFEKWFDDSENVEFGFLPIQDHEIIVGAENFYSLPDSMQYGVLVDFFDSVGITIQIEYYHHLSSFGASTLEKDGRYELYEIRSKPRQEARTKAIEKANEIYNYEKTKE